MFKYILFIFCLGAAVQANEDSSYAEIAKLRQYPSGSDESDLKVQANLGTSANKKKKQQNLEPNEGF